jgi:hypothetical protein
MPRTTTKPKRGVQSRNVRGNAVRKRPKPRPTAGQKKLGDVTQFTKLQQEVGRLTQLVERLVSLIDPEEVAADLRLQKASPANAQLRKWAAACRPPAESAELED